MGYGFGIFLAAIGLIIVYAIDVDIPGIGQQALGWILVAAGVLIVLFTAFQYNSHRRAGTAATTTHPDGSRTVHQDPPPPAV